MKIDLHIHSNISIDGEFSPEELMDRCHNAGLHIVALTDHNSLAGVEAANKRAKKHGMICIPAIELDCVFEETNLHLLGYHVEDRFGWFAENECRIKNLEKATSQKRINLVRSLGLVLDAELLLELAVCDIVTGEMIAEVALNDHRNDHSPLLTPYRPGGNRSDNPLVNFYWDFCSQGKQAYVPMRFPVLREAIEAIRKVGGLPILAHPGINVGRNERLFDGIVSCGIGGLEVFSSYHDEITVKYYRTQAEKRQLPMTAGSDYHGKTKPAIHLGEIDCEIQDKIANWILNPF